MNQYSEADVRAKLIDPALKAAGWDETRIGREKYFTDGRIIVRGKTISRGERKFADYILYYQNNFPIALIEAKDGEHTVGDGMQQGLRYAEILDIPFVYSSNGSGFLEHDRLKESGEVERELSMEEFPTPEDLWQRYRQAKDFSENEESIVLSDDYQGTGAKEMRYYQRNAVNKTVEAVAKGKDRLLLVMATGTGKTFTAFQIIWRLWKSGNKKRILFLVDRTALAQQTVNNDFKPFGNAITRFQGGEVDHSYEIYVALYQGLTAGEENEIFRQFSPEFFDLVIVDECHRGSAKANSSWRKVLDYFSGATQIGLTATPKEEKDVSNSEYFGDPVYTYSLAQGIEDGFLAPYKVVRYRFNNEEWRPNESTRDEEGQEIEDRFYGNADFDKNIIIDARTKAVAERIAEYLNETDPYQKTIVFCQDTEHAERMRQALANALPEYVHENGRYVVRITGNDASGKDELPSFVSRDEKYPVIATTSKLLSTGVDTKTTKLIVLDMTINSMTEFKQIIGRGTRLEEQHGKYYFTIMDFRGATRLFADPEFDGTAIKVYERTDDEPLEMDEEIEEETLSEEEIQKENPREDVLLDGTEQNPKPKKVRIREGVEFYPIQKIVQFIDPETGKLSTETLSDFTKKTILSDYATLDEFLQAWKRSERKDIIINELAEKGVYFDELRREAGKDLDVFDLVLHVAYGKKPLTRSERVKNLSSSDYFTKYEGKAREIIDLLIQKYADHGIEAIDDIGDLKVSPFTEYGRPIEIVDEIFGGREEYLEVIQKIEAGLYQE
ncbi:MAG TPA: DEAD/DEAH box helicase family protein [Candidatus Paceibacterota bacterium]|nr:DEAD/DEAH box helicase family protein [Candidatus Paceibacterota bacterium]